MKFVAGLLLCLTASVMNAAERPVIYQLLPRLFANTNETRKVNGTLAENGCGKFSDINDAALHSIKEMGFTHVWLTGVLEQASGTGYPDRPADPAAGTEFGLVEAGVVAGDGHRRLLVHEERC